MENAARALTGHYPNNDELGMHEMRRLNYIATAVIAVSLMGCASMAPTQSKSRIPDSSPANFSLLLTHNANNASFGLLLKNTSNRPLSHNLLSPHFVVWVVRKDAEPVRLLDLSSLVCIYPNPLPIMQPGETHHFAIPIEPLGILHLGRFNLRGSLVFVEYLMGKESLFSTTVEIHEDLIIGQDRPTTGRTIPPEAGASGVH